MAKESKRMRRLRRTAEAYTNRVQAQGSQYLNAKGSERGRLARAMSLNAAGLARTLAEVAPLKNPKTGRREAAELRGDAVRFERDANKIREQRTTVKTGLARLGQVEKNVARRKSMGGSGG